MRDLSPDRRPEVLFIRFSSLGDVVLATAAVRGLRAAWPGARITFLTKKAYAPLLENHPAIDAVVSFPGPGSDLRSLARLCRELGPFDVLFDLHRSLRSRICAMFVRADRRARYSGDGLRRRLWVLGLMRNDMKAGRSVVDRYLDAVRKVVPVEGTWHPEIHVTAVELERARRLLARKGVSDPARTAVLVPGARWTNKRWTSSGFTAVGRWLWGEKGLQPLIVGDEADRETCRETAASLAKAGAVDLTAATDLTGLAAVLKLTAVVVGNDSGPGHLAAAVGTPVVSIFGPTTEAFGFGPAGPKSRAVSLPVACRPCSLHGGTRCRRGRRTCLDDLAPDQVITAVREVMEGP